MEKNWREVNLVNGILVNNPIRRGLGFELLCEI